MKKRAVNRQIKNRNKAVCIDAISLRYSRKDLCNKYGIPETTLAMILHRMGIIVNGLIVARNINIAHFLTTFDLTQKEIGQFLGKSRQQIGNYLRCSPTGLAPPLKVKLLSANTAKVKAGIATIQQVGHEVLLTKGETVIFCKFDDVEISVDGLKL